VPFFLGTNKIGALQELAKGSMCPAARSSLIFFFISSISHLLKRLWRHTCGFVSATVRVQKLCVLWSGGGCSFEEKMSANSSRSALICTFFFFSIDSLSFSLIKLHTTISTILSFFSSTSTSLASIRVHSLMRSSRTFSMSHDCPPTVIFFWLKLMWRSCTSIQFVSMMMSYDITGNTHAFFHAVVIPPIFQSMSTFAGQLTIPPLNPHTLKLCTFFYSFLGPMRDDTQTISHFISTRMLTGLPQNVSLTKITQLLVALRMCLKSCYDPSFIVNRVPIRAPGFSSWSDSVFSELLSNNQSHLFSSSSLPSTRSKISKDL
jgi:hypothetical protein